MAMHRQGGDTDWHGTIMLERAMNVDKFYHVKPITDKELEDIIKFGAPDESSDIDEY
jgi:hypothetical protein